MGLTASTLNTRSSDARMNAPATKPGDVGIEHDQDAPLQLDLVGVHVAFNAGQKGVHASTPYRTDPSRFL